MAEMMDDLVELEEDTLKDRYLIFSLGKESYGVEVRNVIEIIGMHPITEVPEMPEYIKGFINLRGKIIPVIDARLRFKKEPKEYNDRTCIVVIDIKELSIGLIVDSVSEVLTIPEEDIVDPPTINKTVKNSYIKKIGKVRDEVKLLLDCEKLLSEDELEDISEAL